MIDDTGIGIFIGLGGFETNFESLLWVDSILDQIPINTVFIMVWRSFEGSDVLGWTLSCHISKNVLTLATIVETFLDVVSEMLITVATLEAAVIDVEHIVG